MIIWKWYRYSTWENIRKFNVNILFKGDFEFIQLIFQIRWYVQSRDKDNMTDKLIIESKRYDKRVLKTVKLLDLFLFMWTCLMI